mmetsp:Transcript_25736/g.65427  ORF Transcript_25736/g.65427 Transcript_25736/m.65427 type:complete len:170 (-) Transcript_25736:452-961(-)
MRALLLALLLARPAAFLLVRPASPTCSQLAVVRTRRLPPAVAVASEGPKLSITYCTRCNWMLRSAWLAQEVLTTFNGTIAEVALLPNHEGTGTFECVVRNKDGDDFLVWSRSEEERFPEAKELKQRVRDVIEPDRSLGHSDSDEKLSEASGTGRTAVQRLLALLRPNRG